MISGSGRAFSMVRAGIIRTGATVWRNELAIRETKLRDGWGREAAADAVDAVARSAHRAVATTITAIMCLVRCRIRL
jgi:hypothetical protein